MKTFLKILIGIAIGGVLSSVLAIFQIHHLNKIQTADKKQQQLQATWHQATYEELTFDDFNRIGDVVRFIDPDNNRVCYVAAGSGIWCTEK